MFRSVASKLGASVLRNNSSIYGSRILAATRSSSTATEVIDSKKKLAKAANNPCVLDFAVSDEEFDDQFETFFNRPDIDNWEIRKGLNDLADLDLIPEPRIIIAAFKAARRLNDITVPIRFLELIKLKCGPRSDEIFPYIMQEIKPTMDELGIPTLDELGYSKPELWLKQTYQY